MFDLPNIWLRPGVEPSVLIDLVHFHWLGQCSCPDVKRDGVGAQPGGFPYGSMGGIALRR
eukprot:scaffold155183_cov31-Tisochrysis_lutea.AAC.1